MPEDNLDRFPTLGICVSCGAEIKYSPIRMPLGKPHINADRPGHFSIEYSAMCVSCIRDQLDVLMEKVHRGEMYPTHSWEASEDGSSFHIVPILRSDSSETSDKEKPAEEPKEEKPGLFRRIVKWIY